MDKQTERHKQTETQTDGTERTSYRRRPTESESAWRGYILNPSSVDCVTLLQFCAIDRRGLQSGPRLLVL